MAGFFNKFSEAVGDAFNKASDVAGDLTQTAKFKMEISKYNGEIKELEVKLGRDIVASRLKGATNESLFPSIDECMERIVFLKSEIERVEKQIADLKEDGGDVSKEAGAEASQEKPVEEMPVEEMVVEDISEKTE